MKFITLVALALCAFANIAAAAGDEYDDNVVAKLDPQQLHLQEGSDVITDEDKLLAENLARRDAPGRNPVANAIASRLEDLREVVINGNDVVPPLDPLQVEHIGPFQHSSTGVRIEANVRNLNVEGLRWYVVDHVTVYTLRLALGARITVPWIIVTGNYDAFARIALLAHNAGGNFRVFINRLQVSVDVRVGTSIFGGGALFLRELDIDIVIHDVTVQITGMVGSSVLNNLINSLVQSAAQNLLVDQMEEISKQLSRELFDAVNEILSNFTLDDLFG